MIHKLKRLCRIICLIGVVSALAFPFSASAAESGCTVSIPVSVNLANAGTEDTNTFQIKIEALTPGAPMPAEGDTLTVKGNGKAAFTISCDTAADYEYRISQIKGDNSSVTYDDAAYDVTVQVIYAEDGSMQAAIYAAKNGETGKQWDIEFNNRLPEPTATPTATPTAEPTATPTATPEPTVTPQEPTATPAPTATSEPAVTSTPTSGGSSTAKSVKTGDNTPIGAFVGLAVAAAAVVSFTVYRKKKSNAE